MTIHQTKLRESVNYRMAYVGTVALTNAVGDVLRTIRYAIGAHEDPANITERMMKDLKHTLAVKPSAHVAVVQDGAPELWRLIDEALRRHRLRSRKIHELTDMFHLMERLSKALDIAEPTLSAAAKRAQLEKFRMLLLRDRRGIEKIGEYFELGVHLLWRQFRWEDRYARSKGWKPLRFGLCDFNANGPVRPPPKPLPALRFSTDTREKLEALLQHYLLATYRFRYAHVAKLGLHIGSGVTEAACKSVVGARVKRSGQRWRPTGIDAVLTLRSLHLSGRLASFWPKLSEPKLAA